MARRLPPLDARIPEWNVDDLLERNCPICNCPTGDTAYERPDRLSVRLCKECHTFFVSPSPSERQLQLFYEHYDAKHRRAATISPTQLAAMYQGYNPFMDLRIRELSSLMTFQASRVLDIGFGRAYFMYQLKKLGAIPFGVELDTEAVELAKCLGIDAYHGDIGDLATAATYDLIALIDLVEHPLNPMRVIRKASELLQRGGLMLIWTPNGDLAGIEENPTAFRVDLEHMQYYTPSTCLFIASELRLRIVHLETLGFPTLESMDEPLSKEETPLTVIKRLVKSVPGFSTVNNLRLRLRRRDERTGAYHLFCIMQKPT
jgi:2-polyprenyl-3-methyl-5-hydroxy-6-metoxy-1,4-benzoquinol methylase